MPDEPNYANDSVEFAEPVTIATAYYPATCLGIEDVIHEEHGPRWKWHWSLPGAGPDGADFRLTVWTPPRVSSSGIGNIMAAALGQPYSRRGTFSRAGVRGKQATLYVVLDEAKGRNYVRGATPLEKPQANGAATAPVPNMADPEYIEHLKQQLAQAEAAKQAAAQVANRENDPANLAPPPAEAPAPEAA